MLYDRITKEHNYLETQINSIQSELNLLPEGKLICTRNGSRWKWFQSDGHQKSYLPKKCRKLAEKLAAKKYLSLVLEDLQHEKKVLEFYLRHHQSDSQKAEHLLTDDCGFRELLIPFFTPQSQKLSDWENTAYEHNASYPEQLIHRTSSGHLVRSKSEAMIDLFLFTQRIPFRYECALHLGAITLFPDFTICHPKICRLYYWEHFGLMDDPSYVQNVCSKLQLYAAHGIIPSVNLITTYETKEHPLSSELIEKIIAYYFL